MHSSCIVLGGNVRIIFENWIKVSGIHLTRKYITGEPILDACVRTIITEHPSHWDNDRVELFRKWYIALGAYTRPSRSLISTRLENIFALFQRRIGRRMIRTRKGYIGLAPSTQPGDRIALFRGGKVSSVIRPGRLCWRLIGDCYARGIMHREAFREED